ncbi:MAG: response regulator [Deltaproteobacteria bacterium]|nr:response regulator [Deltaproteobacteria bacterium]
MAKILVIDDEEQIRALLKRIFESLDHFVFVAENGAVGLKMLAQEPFDLVITDIFMPEKEGMETIIEIKRDYPLVKIVAMSGGGSKGCDYLPMAKPLGADVCLNKPFTKEVIVSIVSGLLS